MSFLFWLVVLGLLAGGVWLWLKDQAQERWIREQMSRLDRWLEEQK